jgi:hypothetical protein
MREQVLAAVEKYIDAVERNDATALPLDEDVIAEFPTNTYRGAAEYRAGLDPFHRILKGVKVRHLVADEEHCVAILELDTVFGVIPFAEHLRVVEGKIVWIRGYCDPRVIIEGMGKAS